MLDIGSEAVVVSAPAKNGDVQVKVGPLAMKTKLDRLRKLSRAGLRYSLYFLYWYQSTNTDVFSAGLRGTSKSTKVRGADGGGGGGGGGGVGGGRVGSGGGGRKKGNYSQLLSRALRTPGNTLGKCCGESTSAPSVQV